MQRGIVKFSPEAISFLLPKLTESTQDTTLLQQKFQSALQAGGTTEVMLSEDEADILLDVLPSPQQGEDTNVTTIRKDLTEFLQKMRNPQNNNGGSGVMSKFNPFNWFK